MMNKYKGEITRKFGDKERTLRNMLKPSTWEEIIDMLSYAGCKDIQPSWRNHAFVGAIAIK